VDASGPGTLTIDDLAAVARTTTRRIRSLQTLGLLPHPVLHGRTGRYGATHRGRLVAIQRLQEQGFSLESLVLLFDALDTGRSLAWVLGTAAPTASAVKAQAETDSAELYGFAELQPTSPDRRRGRPLLSVVPTTMWDESEAS
jgi:DNA-binding transcriptional MerR regulator